MFDIDNYFKDFIKNEKIFDNRDVLRPEFIPNILPHRDLQIQRIAEIVACTLKNSMPSNIFIFGKPGTGKTAVVGLVSERLNHQCRKTGIAESQWIFLNCQQVNTGYRILAKICGELDPNDKIPIAGWPIDVVFDKLVEKLDQFVEGNCFLVLDEIDILVKNVKKNHDILYNLARINARLKRAKVNIIGISNVLTFKSALDPRVLSSLGEEEIIFPAYNAMELSDILRQRAKIAFNHDALDEDVIPLCAALAAKEHGDARKALDLLRKAGELAERRNIQNVGSRHVYLAHDDIEKDKMQEYCEALPIQSKTILLSIYHMQKYKGDQAIITGDVYNAYSEISQLVPGLNTLTQRRVSELIRELDLSGMVNARVKSNGRYGRTKFIRLNIPLKDTTKYLMSERRLNELIGYKPIWTKENTTRFKSTKFRRLV
jgi:archaeal cell division control protein 6